MTHTKKRGHGFVAIHFIFIVVFLIIKITSLVIAGNHLDSECSNGNHTPIGYLESCRSNAVCIEGYICSTDQMCYCDLNTTSILIVNATSCIENSECPDRQVCSIETLQCVYPEICEYSTTTEDEDPTMTLALWLLIYGIVGMVAGIFALMFVCCEIICCENGGNKDDCLNRICIIGGTWSIGIIYLCFSLAWNWYGWYVLYEEQYSCKDLYPTLWNFSVANCVLLYFFIAFNPITYTIINDNYCKR